MDNQTSEDLGLSAKRTFSVQTISLKDNQHLIDLIRVRSYQKQKRIRELWSYNEDELQDYFATYPLADKIGFTLKQLGDSEYLRLVQSEHRIYFGEIYQHQKHGKGICIYKDGKIFQGNFDCNQKTGPGYQIYPNSNVYIGDFQKNKKHGVGTFYWFNLASKQHTEYYVGEWWAGLPSGQGIHQRANGDYYEGEFKNGLKHGEGIQKFTNGDVYVGQFVNGFPQGYGEYVWSDGSNYKGDFKQGLRNGFGIWKKNDAAHCESYRGNYLLDRKSGYGVYVWENGDYYKGEFFDDKKHGMGELGNHKKIIYNGMWENGERAEHLNGTTRKPMDNRKVKENGADFRKTAGPSELTRDMSEGCIRGIMNTSNVSRNAHNLTARSTKRGAYRQTQEQSQANYTPNKDIPNYMKPLSRRCGHKNCIPHRDYGHMPHHHDHSKSRGKDTSRKA